MDIGIETIGCVAFVFAATALVALAAERRMDVLYGPYIEGRARRRVPVATRLVPVSLRRLADRVRWSVRDVVCLAATIAG
jgi:hypothetical protein